MSQIVTLELSDQAFTAIRQRAESVGIPPEHLIARLLERQFFGQVFKLLVTEAEKEEARARFEQHFGTIGLGYEAGVDNESIDGDLAREYANTHERE